MKDFNDLQIAVPEGISIATLLSQHHKVTVVDIKPEKIKEIN